MHKNQLQELAQRSCFNLPSYACIREGPDHAPRFKATVNFNGETFESPSFCSTLRQAEHAAAEVALNTLSKRGPSRALAARVLDETGVYKNLLQETAHRAGLNLPVYTTIRSGPGHVPIFSCTVELAGMSFPGEPAKTKKQAQKNAAMTAWSSLKQLSQLQSSSHSSHPDASEEQEQVVIARFLSRLPPAASNSSNHQNWQHIPIRTTPEITAQPPNILYPIPSQQSWVYSNLFTEMAPPPAVHCPQFVPFMQYFFHPNPYFDLREKEPRVAVSTSNESLYFSNYMYLNPLRGRSMVTIQEIQEEKAEESSSSVICANNVTIPDEVNVECENTARKAYNEKNVGLNLQSEEKQIGQLGEKKDLKFRHVELRKKNPEWVDSGSNVRPHNITTSSTMATAVPSSSVGSRPHNRMSQMHAPSKTGTWIPSCSSGPRSGRGFPNFMAPPVQIRSVVPVCSAPPARNNAEGVRKTTEVKDSCTASSELSKLQI